MRFLKRVNDRGTLTLPAEVREALQVRAGDIVEFEVVGVVRRNTGADSPIASTHPIPERRPIA